jgi:putative membrane-bound dehydrogenase-like protein
MRLCLGIILSASIFIFIEASPAQAELQVGLAKSDITPSRPLRLSGYGNRDRPYEGVDAPIFARTLAIRESTGKLTVWTAVELLGVTSAMRQEVLKIVGESSLSPERFILCATHTHTAPHSKGVATNLFGPKMNAAEIDAMDEYTTFAVRQIAQSVIDALKDLKPGKLEIGWGKGSFAANRRVMKNGKWQGFGVQKDGPVDHRLPVIRITNNEGKLCGIVFNYACHATTIPGEYNRLSGDWPGFASSGLESTFPGVIALTLIGCGADANPEPRGTLDLAKQHGQEAHDAVVDVLKKPMRSIGAPTSAILGFAGLPSDRPSRLELTARLASKDPVIQQHAKNMLAILERKDRLPETYPAPIQVVRFGNELTMIFLGGEVVVDYALRLDKELAALAPAEKLWITAYANDVYGYLASERMRKEGGYEYDYSMYFYNQPGPWSTGTEEIVVRRVHDLIEHPEGEGNLSPTESLKHIHVAEGLEVELVAAEPLVKDPVNVAFGPDGKLWVAEMGDYPLGEDNHGSPGGRIRYLEDTDRDGRFDKSTLFLEGLHFATGIFPWKEGVLVSAPPAIIYAEIDPATGKASKQQVILDGFEVGNPQHVVNGFCVGIDNWIYINGDDTGVIRSPVTDQKVNMQGRDGRFKPFTGELETECGMTQHLRSRNDFGHWFGGANYCPYWHYVLEEKYIRRNPYVASPRPWKDLYGGFYPQVFPSSRIVDRFNDLFTAGRFTSACSPNPYRDSLLGEQSDETIFACEPVHNLVHRSRYVKEGLEFRAERFPIDAQSEFFSSADPWSRPVRALTGPDGAVWIADMYRQVIEHPNWIPEAWLARLDVRSGSDKGRIYRVYPKGKRPGPLPILRGENPSGLVKRLESSNGWERDMAQHLLIMGKETGVTGAIEAIVKQSSNPKATLSALGTLEGLGVLRPEILKAALRDAHPDVRRWAIRFSEPFLDRVESLVEEVAKHAADDEISVRFQVACSLGEHDDARGADALGIIAARDADNEWMRAAILSSSIHHPEIVLRKVLAAPGDSKGKGSLVDGLLATAIGVFGEAGVERVLAQVLPPAGERPAAWQYQSVATLMDALDRRGTTLLRWSEGAAKKNNQLVSSVQALMESARAEAIEAENSNRVAAISVLGRGIDGSAEDRALLTNCLPSSAPIEVQLAAIQTLAKLRTDDVPQILLSDWRSRSPSARSEVLSVLMSRPEWIDKLLNALEAKEVLPADLGASVQQALVTHTKSSVSNRAMDILASSQQSRQAVLDEHQSVLTMKGDPSRGRELFVKNCANCHRFGGLGQIVGPDLGGVRDRTPPYLLLSVLDPNRAVESKYLSYTAEMTDGRVLSGMIVIETSGSITLARPDGKVEKLLRVDIERLVSSGKSFMPEGLEKDISPQGLADIFSFIAQNPETVK